MGHPQCLGDQYTQPYCPGMELTNGQVLMGPDRLETLLSNRTIVLSEILASCGAMQGRAHDEPKELLDASCENAGLVFRARA